MNLWSIFSLLEFGADLFMTNCSVLNKSKRLSSGRVSSVISCMSELTIDSTSGHTMMAWMEGLNLRLRFTNIIPIFVRMFLVCWTANDQSLKEKDII